LTRHFRVMREEIIKVKKMRNHCRGRGKLEELGPPLRFPLVRNLARKLRRGTWAAREGGGGGEDHVTRGEAGLGRVL